jgi:hypothetical protein
MPLLPRASLDVGARDPAADQGGSSGAALHQGAATTEAARVQPIGAGQAVELAFAVAAVAPAAPLAAGVAGAGRDHPRKVGREEGAGAPVFPAAVTTRTPAARASLIAWVTSIRSCWLQRLISATYTLLGLRSYFTTGEKEPRAWTIKAGSQLRRRRV